LWLHRRQKLRVFGSEPRELLGCRNRSVSNALALAPPARLPNIERTKSEVFDEAPLVLTAFRAKRTLPDWPDPTLTSHPSAFDAASARSITARASASVRSAIRGSCRC
jgi:hypothetical protein